MNPAVPQPPSRPGQPRRTVRWVVAISVVVVIVGVLVALSPHHSSARPTGLTGKLISHGTANVVDGRAITMILGERSFSPTFLKGAPDTRVVVLLHAEGFHAHSFTVPSLGIDITIPPGGTAEVPITIPAGPTTLFYCRFHGPVLPLVTP